MDGSSGDSLVLVAILAGGRSSRFGSDKARALLDGKPLILRLAEAARVTGAPIVAVAEATDKYADLDLRTLADRTPGQGPIGGLETALHHAPAPGWVMVASCDLLELRSSWIAQLHAHARAAPLGTQAVAFKSERWQPFPGLYHTDMLSWLQQRIAQGELAMQAMLDAVGAMTVAMPPDWPRVPQANTLDELRRAQATESKQ